MGEVPDEALSLTVDPDESVPVELEGRWHRLAEGGGVDRALMGGGIRTHHIERGAEPCGIHCIMWAPSLLASATSSLTNLPLPAPVTSTLKRFISLNADPFFS